MTTNYESHSILIVDDQQEIRDSFIAALQSAGMTNLLTSVNGEEAIETIEKNPVSVVLLDLIMPGISGMEVLETVKKRFPWIQLIIITGTEDLHTAVECMKKGAFDYLVKVVEENTLIAAVNRALEINELKKENQELKEHFLASELNNPEAFSRILTGNPRMKSIFLYMEAIAATSKPVLITGETGTGKELIAEAIHTLSCRRGAYVPVNISSFDDALFSDTVFGHQKGAYTGADTSQPGLIESAAEGTLFLDEIGDLSPNSQIKLLRLLENGQYLPLGSSFMKKADARIVVATNRDLDREMENGSFRRDLYYRLFTHHIHLPPLRERREDLPLLIDHFFARSADELSRPKPPIPSQFLSLCDSYNFPGNIRELESIIADTMSRSTPGDFDCSFAMKKLGVNPVECSDKHEKATVIFMDTLPSIKEVTGLLVNEAMKRAHNNQSIAARMIGISQQALNKRLKNPPPSQQ